MKSIFRNIKPEVFFILAGLIFGTFFSIIIPFGAGFDEETHLVRIFDISGGHLIPNRPTSDGNYTFSEFFSLSYQRRPIQTPASGNFSAQIFGQKPNWENMSSGHTESTYLPIMFFPEAIVAGLGWRIFNFPLLPVIILMRIVGLITYIGMCFFAIRIVPIGKWVLTVLLLAPMAMFQASTLNGDHFTIAASVLFIAYLIRVLSVSEPIQRKEAFFLSVCVILIGIAKPGTIILLPALFLLIWKKFTAKSSLLLIFLSAIFSIVISIYWSSMAVLFTTYLPSGATRADQIKLILNNFPDFLRIYFFGVFNLIPKYYTDWVAEYGYWMGKVPWPVYAIFPISLGLAFLGENRFEKFARKDRWIVALTGVFCLGIMASVKFVWAYVPSKFYFGSQGRYFLPFAPAFFLAFTGLFAIAKKWQKTVIISSLGLIVIALGIYGYGIYRTYYTTCIFAVDSKHPCTLPVYRNLDVNNPVNIQLTKGNTFKQTFVPKCDPINAIDLRVISLKDDLTGSIQITLLNSEDEILGSSQTPINQIIVGNQNQFQFSTTDIHQDETYSFQVSLSEDASASLGLWGAPDDGYTAGQLFINDKPDEFAHDLYFQYECPR